MTERLTISLLGYPRFVRNGRSLQLTSTKATALLAYLSVSGMLHSRAQLAALLWPESDNKHGRGALRYTLSVIKKELGDDFLITNRQQIGLEPTACDVDVVQVRQLLSPALGPLGDLTADQCEQVAQGVALYRADFLSGFSLPDCEQFNEWAFIQADTLRRDMATALKRLSLVFQQAQEWDAALDCGHRWLNLDPLHEPAHVLLMQLYAESGQWTAVHDQYQALNDLLEQELGVPPQPETTALYQELCQTRTVEIDTPTPLGERSPEQRSQWVLMEKMRRFWVNGLLSSLRAEEGFIHLKLQALNASIEHPWADVLETRQTPTPANIYHAFRNANRALLILGAPGAGKTVSLVELAEYLLAMAATDEMQPLPVILNLSSWAGKQVDIATWAVEEIVAKYQIPRLLGRKWLGQDRLLLLFDGLDEMLSDYRVECLMALNTFRQAYGLADMVVCCRQEAYETAVATSSTRLLLNGAVLIRPLTTNQIRENVPTPLADSLFADETLLEMAQSPLTLTMLRLAFSKLNGNTNDNPQATAVPTTTNQLFDIYIQTMFQRQATRVQNGPSNIKVSKHLTWLATQMQHHNLSIFLIEELQPSWLKNGRLRWIYLLLTRSLFTAVLGTPIGWSFIQLLQINPPGIELQFLSQAAARVGVTAVPWNGILSIFMLVLCTGLVVGLVDGCFFTWRRHRGNEDHINRKLGWLQLVCVSVAVIVSATFLFALTDGWLVAFALACMEAVCFILAYGYLNFGQSWRTEVRARGALTWSWHDAAILGLLGIGLSIIWSGVAWLQDPASPRWLLNFLATGFTFFLLGGVRGKKATAQNRPNEGIRIAGTNGIKAALLLFIPTTLLIGIVINPLSGLLTGILYGMLAGIMHGFNDVLKHLAIRVLLWFEHSVPLRYFPLLDYASDSVLLQKVGGGFTFRHRLLQEHFVTTGKKRSR